MFKKEIKTDVPMHVMVLQAGAWPLTSPTNFTEPSSSQQESNENYVPPPILQNSLRLFEEFYITNHSGRKLSWLYGNSSADVQLNYLERQYQGIIP